MKTILSLSWRDIRSDKAGGAEVHTHEMLSRIDKSKYRVIHIAMASKDKEGNKLPAREVIDGVRYIRHGNFATVIAYAMSFYRKYCDRIDIVIDQCNTHRFFTPFWVSREKRVFYIHQLTREIWGINLKFIPLRLAIMAENMMLWLNRHDKVITVSESTKGELRALGYDGKICIIHNGVSFVPWTEDRWLTKEDAPTFAYVGRYSPYKGIDKALEAIGKLKEKYPNIRLWILGKKDEEYVEKHLMPICNKYGLTWGNADESDAVNVVSWGFVSEEDKLKILSRSHALVFPSIREGWGIPITEAGCVGTPSIVFDSPGIAEATDYGNAGYLCHENTVEGIKEEMLKVIEDEELYRKMRQKAYKYSSEFRWEKSGQRFEAFMDIVSKNKNVI